MNESLNLTVYVFSPSAVEYIAKYISSHCNPINNISERTQFYFVLRIYSKENTQTCYVADKIPSKPYIEELINWIKASPYKGDCKDILSNFEHIMSYLNKH